ncbi:signal peptidase I [Microbacterium sp. Leaf320]|uniref:signal peptidase I n=1 Tax=Microbacterium sp. Leaf320 TaxID=1736334 RepID=UPI001F3F8F63|nr:signal peptidase I [Microbacterium sp. Leaf320]
MIAIVLVGALASFGLKSYVVRTFYIPSPSMENTLLVQDRVLVDLLTPHWVNYERGDVVVFTDPGGWLSHTPPVGSWASRGTSFADRLLSFAGADDPDEYLVKRIVGLPGDHVICCTAEGFVTVNGEPVDERAYLNGADVVASHTPFDVVVPPGAVWLLGDNRDRSSDARSHQDLPSGGFVPIENIVGKAVLRWWPLDRWGTIDAHHEVFDAVPPP